VLEDWEMDGVAVLEVLGALGRERELALWSVISVRTQALYSSSPYDDVYDID
jgi:hypothetical protein